MTELNYSLKKLLPILWKNCSIEYDLAENIPDIPDEVRSDILPGLIELINEIDEHSDSNKRKIRRNIDDKSQIIELAWNGNPISERDLDFINGRYELGRKSPTNTYAGGAFVAGYKIGSRRGKIIIENSKGPIYRVRNIVTLPLNFS